MASGLTIVLKESCQLTFTCLKEKLKIFVQKNAVTDGIFRLSKYARRIFLLSYVCSSTEIPSICMPDIPRRLFNLSVQIENSLSANVSRDAEDVTINCCHVRLVWILKKVF